MAYSAPLYNQQQEQGHYPSPAPSPNHYQQYHISYHQPPHPHQQPPQQLFSNPYQQQAYPFQGYQNQTYLPQQQQQPQQYAPSPVPQHQHHNYQQSAVPPPAVPAHLIVPSQHSEPYPQEPVFPQASPPGATVYTPQTPQSLPPVTPQSRAPITPQSNPSATPDSILPHPTTPASTTTTIARNWPFNLGPADIIDLQIHAKDAQTDLFIPSVSLTQTPLYTATYSKSSHWSHSRDEPHVKIYHHSATDPRRQVGTCTYHSPFNNKFSMNVLGLEWDFDTNWVSDVGTCEGRHLEWTLPNKRSKPVGFTLQCVDVSSNKKVICCVKIEDYSRGHLQISGGILENQKGLDEMVTVAVGMMQRMRGRIKEEGAGAVGLEASGKVDTDFAKNSFKAGWQVASLVSGGGGGA